MIELNEAESRHLTNMREGLVRLLANKRGAKHLSVDGMWCREEMNNGLYVLSNNKGLLAAVRLSPERAHYQATTAITAAEELYINDWLGGHEPKKVSPCTLHYLRLL